VRLATPSPPRVQAHERVELCLYSASWALRACYRVNLYLYWDKGWTLQNRDELIKTKRFCFSHGATAPSGPGPPHYRGFMIILRHTPQSVGLLWTSDQPDAETSTWQHTTLTRERHPRHWRDSNPQSQEASGRRPMPYIKSRNLWTRNLRIVIYAGYSSFSLLYSGWLRLFFPRVKWPGYEADHSLFHIVLRLEWMALQLHSPILLHGVYRALRLVIILSLFFLFGFFLAAVWWYFTAVKGKSFCFSLSLIQFARPRDTPVLKMSLDKICCVATLHHPSSLCSNFAVLLFI
jgi:hypothetical protein